MTSGLHRRGPGGGARRERGGTGLGIGRMLRYISRVEHAACSVADQKSKQEGSMAFHAACTHSCSLHRRKHECRHVASRPTSDNGG